MTRHRLTRRAASIGLAMALVAASVAPVAATTVVDFGSVSLGGVASQDEELPLDAALSELPPDTVLYTGGNASIDLALSLAGLSAPLTAGALHAAIGEVTVTYHIAFDLPAGDFAITDSDCESGSGTCAVELEFSPSQTGLREAVAAATLTDVQASGGGSFASLISLLAPFLAGSVESQLDLELTGHGIEGSGGVTLEVAVEPAAVPCLIIDASVIDFGTLAFSTDEALSNATRDVHAHSCSSGPEAIYAQGTDATGDQEPTATWTLSGAGGNPCATGPDVFGVHLTGDTDSGIPSEIDLSTVSAAWLTLEAEQTAQTTVDYRMPCAGSSGAGQTMTSQITFLATVP